jgi:predicted AlkP superfamily phosphohydrolase/phosphomutase/tetratricopeptide (TPR) repeat protein
MKQSKVLLVGWDAADWQVINPLIEAGEMPVLSGLIDGGVMGDLATLEPVLSPMLWNSVATGKRADAHGVLGFTEVWKSQRGDRVRPVTSTSRRVKALWNILSQAGLRSNVVGWFGSHPAEPIQGSCISDAFVRAFPDDPKAWPMMPGTVFPESLMQTIGKFRIHPSEIDREIVRMFVPRASEINPSKPNRIPALCRILAECFSTHAAATWLMENEPWDFMAVYYIGIDHFSHSFINFHPPRLPWVQEGEFELYKDVVAGGYKLMDLFLARLLELAGPDTRVVVLSDHGFHSGSLRPKEIPNVPAGPCAQHRPLGIFAMKGEGIRRDERIYGMNLLDVAPTILSLFGLPPGKDMPGRVLTEAFETPPLLDRIPSWETVTGDSGMHTADVEMDQEDADALIDQFVALGYINEPSRNREKAAADCRRENDWNLARVYLSTWRFAEALPLLEQIHAGAPDRIDFALTLADCRRRLGLFEEAEATVNDVIAEQSDAPVARFVLGNIAFEQGRISESLAHFLAARKAAPERHDVISRIGFALLKLRHWNKAAHAFEDALRIYPDDHLSHQGLGLALMRRHKFEEAAESLLAAIGLRHDVPQSHYWFGVCLLALGRRERARQAFEMALSFEPPLLAAHRWLAKLAGDPKQTAFHRDAARAFFRLRREKESRNSAVREHARRRAAKRSESQPQPEARATRPPPVSRRACSLIVVSGLPRSGTSLMMQMLHAGGIPVMTDELRGPDQGNPAGYFEWAPIKGLAEHPEIVEEADDKAVKIVSMLLPALPKGNKYKVIFMDRPVEEVFASQQKMIGADNPAQTSAPGRMIEMLRSHRRGILEALKRTKGFELLIVSYPDLVRNPVEWIPRIVDFLGGVPDSNAMAEAIQPALYRNRSAG